MKKLIYLLLLLPFVGFSQNSQWKKQGDVFDSRKPAYISQKGDTAVIVVTRTLTATYFEDPKLPNAYKKLIEKFFNDIRTDPKFKKLNVKHHLNIRKDHHGDIYIENVKMGSFADLQK